VVAEREWELQEKEEEVASMLERRRSEVSSREADLDTCETALEVDRKSLGDLRAEVLTNELAADIKANHLTFRERELADKEKQLVVMPPPKAGSHTKKTRGVAGASGC
jgi:hypothetical protein